MSGATRRPTPGDVLQARRWFVYSHVEGGSGWFEAHHFAEPHEPDKSGERQRAEDLFDTLAEDGALTEAVYIKWADWQNKQDCPEPEPTLSNDEIETALRRVPNITLSMDEYDALAGAVGVALDGKSIRNSSTERES